MSSYGLNQLKLKILYTLTDSQYGGPLDASAPAFDSIHGHFSHTPVWKPPKVPPHSCVYEL